MAPAKRRRIDKTEPKKTSLPRHLRKLTPEKRASCWEHIYELGAKHDIEVNKAKGGWFRSEAHLTSRQVYVPTQMTDISCYLIALHELGHIASPKASTLFNKDDPESQLLCEAAAWAWALKNADRELVGDDPRYWLWSYIGKLWGSYCWSLWTGKEEPA